MRSTDHRLMEESSSPSSHYFSIFTNYPLLSAVLAFTIAQFIKFFTTWYVYYSYVVSENGLDKDRDFTDNSVLYVLSKGIRKRDGIWNGLLGLEECLLHIQQLLQLLLWPLVYKKALEDLFSLWLSFSLPLYGLFSHFSYQFWLLRLEERIK